VLFSRVLSSIVICGSLWTPFFLWGTMELSLPELIKKFTFLEKFKDQEWILNNSIDKQVSDKEIPFHVCLLVINETIDFIEKTKFSSHWESCFSTKARLMQVKKMLEYFCEESILERSKSSNSTQK